jgi:VWFA-related protein
MRARFGVLGVLAGLFVLIQPLGAARQQTTAPPGGDSQTPQATFRSRIDSVQVDVQVSDKQGNPVTGLTEQDFDVREAGKPQTIDTFKYIAVDDTPVDPVNVPEILSIEDQQRETAKDDARVIVIFLDDYHTHSSAALRIRPQLANWVRNLNPRTLVALATPLMPVTAMTFSHDMNATAAQIMMFIGRKYDYQPKYPQEQNLAFLDPRIIEQTRNTVVISALQATCAYLSTLREGRKTVIYVSEGMTGEPQGATIASAGRGTATASNPSFVSMDLMNDFLDVFRNASRTNTAIYTMDPRGLAASAIEVGDPGSQYVSPTTDHQLLTDEVDVLRTIADNTGGRAILGTNDALPGLKQLLKDSSGYYLLSYTSTERPRDGKFHPISVKVNKKDVEIRARKGYYAYTNDEVTKALAPPKAKPPAAVTEALDSVQEPGRDHPFQMWAGAVRGDDGKSVVTLSWETAAAYNAAAGSKGDPIDHVTLEARSDMGAQVYAGDLKPDPKAATPAGSISFPVPPGSVRVRASAMTASGVRLDTINRDVEVPDFTAVGTFITTPAVFSAHTAREMTQIRTAPVPVPTPARVFSRTERLLVRFQAYGPGGNAPTVTLKLLNQDGQPMVDLPPPVSKGNGAFEVEVGLGSLAAASYVFEIDAASGETKAQALIAVRVTG